MGDIKLKKTTFLLLTALVISSLTLSLFSLVQSTDWTIGQIGGSSNDNVAYSTPDQYHPWTEVTNKPDFSSLYQNNTYGSCASDEFLYDIDGDGRLNCKQVILPTK